MSDCTDGVNDILKESLENAYQKGFKCGLEKGHNETPVWVVTYLDSGRFSMHVSIAEIFSTEKAAMEYEAIQTKQYSESGIIRTYRTEKRILDPKVYL